MVQVKAKRLNDNAVLPFYAFPGEDACMDMTAISCIYDEEKDCYVYGTGWAFEVPQGYVMLLFPRSSNRKTDGYLPNSVGVIDSGYRGEVMFSYKNRTATNVRDYIQYATDGEGGVLVSAPYEVGDRIGQFMVVPYPQVQLILSDNLATSARGAGGHGSTGN